MDQSPQKSKLPDYIEKLRVPLLHAGLLAESFYRSSSYEVWQKKGQGPCSSADLAVNQLLEAELSALLPESGWLSEESPDSKQRLDRECVWIVDPIDGTRDFIQGSPEFSVSAALVQNGLPVLGGVALPARQELILGQLGYGLEYWGYDCPRALEPQQIEKLSLQEFKRQVLPQITWQKKTIASSQCMRLEDARLLVSRTEWKNGKLGIIRRELSCIPESSIARKLALLAVGEADGVISVFPKHEWDIAAGVALLLCKSDYGAIELTDFREHKFNSAQTLSYGLAAGPLTLLEQFQAYWKGKDLKVFLKWT